MPVLCTGRNSSYADFWKVHGCLMLASKQPEHWSELQVGVQGLGFRV